VIAGYVTALRRLGRDVRLILVSLAVFGFAFFGVFATLFNLYILRLGHGPEFVGLINGAAGLAYGFSCLPSGALGRRFGARRVMVAGMGMLVIGLASAAQAGLAPAAWQRGGMLVAYLLANLGFALYFVNISPFLMAATGPQERDHAFSSVFALVPLGGFAGSLAGGVLPGLFARLSSGSLDGPAPYRQALLAASLCLIMGVCALWAVQEVGDAPAHARAGRGQVSGAYSYVAFVATGVFYFLWIAGEQGIRSLFNVYLDANLGVPTVQVGALLALAQLLSMAGALTMPALSARWGLVRTIVVAAAGMGLSILLVGMVPHLAAAGAGYLGMAALSTVARPAITVFSQGLVTPEWRSVMSGSVSMIAGLGSSAASTAAGFVASAHGFDVLFVVSAAALAVSVVTFGGYFGRARGRRVRDE